MSFGARIGNGREVFDVTIIFFCLTDWDGKTVSSRIKSILFDKFGCLLPQNRIGTFVGERTVTRVRPGWRKRSRGKCVSFRVHR